MLEFQPEMYIQLTFLLCPIAVDIKKDHKETIYANLKNLKDNNICTNVSSKKHSFEPKKSESGLESVGEIFETQKTVQRFTERKEVGNDQLALLQKHQYNTPSKIEKVKRHILILDHCHAPSVYTLAHAGMLNHLSVKQRHIIVTFCFLVQGWVGVPRAKRLNATKCLIFKTSDIMRLDQIYSKFVNTLVGECFDAV